MIRRKMGGGAWAGLAILTLSAGASRAEDIPIRSLRDWQFYNDRAWKAFQKGDMPRAEELFHAAINVARPYSAGDQRLLARSYNDLAKVLCDEGRFADAEPLAKWALTVRQTHPRVQPEAVFQTLILLGKIERGRRSFPEAESYLRRALTLQEKLQGKDHPDSIATLDELAGVSLALQKLGEAEALYRRAMAVHRRRFNVEDVGLAVLMEHRAVALHALGRNDEARVMEAHARTIREEAAAAKAGRPRKPRTPSA